MHIVQCAYHVSDVDAAVDRWHKATGIGPFIVRRHIRLGEVFYRGKVSSLDISVAHAQAGDIQIELVTQHCGQPSAFRDSFTPDQEGFHHVAVFPKDHDAMVAHYKMLGHQVSTDLMTAEGRGASYVDTRPLFGHMIEIYRPNPSLFELYAMIAEVAQNGSPRDTIIELP